jgi:tetratricopeptide (TPR) repeat protein
VISRTSVMQYRAERNVRKIANALRVSHVLEGSVRKTGDQIHLNAQLIDARTDTHLWAQTYDRGRSDLFAVEAELAHQVAKRLGTHVSMTEQRALETIPTRDLEAYDLYTQGRQLLYNASLLEPSYVEKLAKAADLFEKAVARDNSFALAYCALAEANLRAYWQPSKSQDRRDKAEGALKQAMHLAPDAGETHLVHGLFLYWVEGDYDRALEEFETAAQLLPNNAQVYDMSSWTERRMGRWRAAIRHSAKAVDLNPAWVESRYSLILNHLLVRRYADAIRLADQAIVAVPGHADTFRILKVAAMLHMGDLENARRTIDSLSPDGRVTTESFLLKVYLLLYERNYAEAARHVDRRTEIADVDSFLEPASCFQGFIAHAENNSAKTAAAFGKCGEELRPQLRKKPIGDRLSTLALADAALGRREVAIDEAVRARELTDEVSRFLIMLDLPKVYCWLGDRERALNELEKLLNEGAIGVNYGDLKFNPAWDPLRDDPRFEKILGDAAKPISLK